MIFVVGTQGRLGQAIVREYADSQIVPLQRGDYQDWSNPGSYDKVSRFFGAPPVDSLVFVASGLLDPQLEKDELLRVNYLLPRNIIEGATKLGMKIVTFGTVMEGLLASNNPYVATKARLGDYVAEIASKGVNALHLRLHTLYGNGEPSPFMFLGQMLSALRHDTPFRMTPGKQLREYHHVDDEATAIRRLAESAPAGVTELSHGKPVRLHQIAETVFHALNQEHLLEIGAIHEPPKENYKWVYTRSILLEDLSFRDTLPAVTNYMRDCLGRPTRQLPQASQ